MSVAIDRAELQQIYKKVAPLVLQFCREHETFYSRELDAYVEAALGRSANETATRVLRKLRQKEHLDYYVEGHRFFVLREPKPDNQLDFEWDDETTNEETNECK